MSRPGAIWIDGDRFEASVSPGRTMSDIVDRKFDKKFVLLDRENLEELGRMVGVILDGDPVFMEGARFEGYVSMNRKYADIIDRRHRHRLTQLDQPALEELKRMIEEVLGAMK